MKLHKIHSMEPSHSIWADGQMCRETDMTKLQSLPAMLQTHIKTSVRTLWNGHVLAQMTLTFRNRASYI
jgi:hypothetical protein